MSVGRYWLQTLGCPKNQVDSDKLEGYLDAQGLPPRPDPADGRPRRRQHLRLHRGGPPGVDRHRPGAGRPPRPGARLVVTGCMAERYGDELRDALPEVDLVAGFGRDLIATTSPGPPPPGPRHPSGRAGPMPGRRRAPPSDGFDLLELPRPAPEPLGLREGRRGLRPHLRLLRHPLLPGQAALPLAPTRSWPRSTRSCAAGRPVRPPVARDRARRPGPRLLRPGPHGPRPAYPHRQRSLAHRRAHPRRLGAGRAHPAALPLPVRPDRRADRGGAGHRRALLRPLAPARVAPAPRPHAPLGRRRALPAPHRRHPGRRARRHLPLLVHPRLPRRDRARPRPAPPIPRGRRSSTGPASSPSPTRTGRTPPASPTRCRPSWRSSACASAPSSRTPSPRPGGTASSASRARCWSTRPAGAARCTRRPRSTASCMCPPTTPGGQPRRGAHHRRRGPRPARRPGRRPQRGARRRGSATS